jgi:HSP20 family protein
MRRFSEEMDRIFEDFGYGRSRPGFWSSGFGGGLTPRSEFGRTLWSPQIEMFERGNQLVIRADLPGLNRDNIKLEVADNCLTIEGERRHEQEENQEGHYHSERSYGRFYRCIELPKGVDPGSVNATFRDGVLEVTMPKPPSESSGGRRIEIQEGAGSRTADKK